MSSASCSRFFAVYLKSLGGTPYGERVSRIGNGSLASFGVNMTVSRRAPPRSGNMAPVRLKSSGPSAAGGAGACAAAVTANNSRRMASAVWRVLIEHLEVWERRWIVSIQRTAASGAFFPSAGGNLVRLRGSGMPPEVLHPRVAQNGDDRRAGSELLGQPQRG